MFVAITKITEHGQPVFCVNPVETTLDFRKAFKFQDRQEIERALKDASEIYQLNAFPVEIVTTETSIQRKTTNQLQVV